MTIEQMREAIKKVNKSPKWYRKIDNMTPNDIAAVYKRLKQQNQI